MDLAAVHHAAIGRTVHYVLPNGQCRPAKIVQAFGASANDVSANLVVTYNGREDVGLEAFDHEACSGHHYSVRYSQIPTPGTWHWPPVPPPK